MSMVVTVGCADDDTTVADSPDPTEIAQSHFAAGCLIVRGDLRCFRSNPPTAPELYERERVLLQRDEPLDGPPQSAVDLGGEHVTSIVGGYDFRCASLASGGVKCWGFNDDSEFPLGVPDPTAIIGDDPAERGGGMPFVDLGEGLSAVQLATASFGACARFDDGRVKCWGSDPCLGCGITGEVLGDEPGEMGDALPFVDLGTGVRAAGIVGGNRTTCIWTADGRVKCWGLNDRGQAGLPVTRAPLSAIDREPIGDDPGEMGDALPFVDLGHDVRVTQVSIGTYHACALTDAGRIKCWGANYDVTTDGAHPDPIIEVHRTFGRLGLGDRENREAPLGDALPYVDLGSDFYAIAVTAGDMSTCAVSSDMRLKCWGGRHVGLGLLEEDIGDEPGEMGDALPYVDLGEGRTVAMIDYPGYMLLDDGGVRCWFPAEGLVGDALEPCILPQYTGWIE
jgi:hypothetical protein